LYDPQFNIEYGCKMLKDLYLHYGNWRDALMYYGPYDIGYGYADLVLSLQGQYSPAGVQISAG
jgi:soluble lytic murein transglycosylase-like protein